MKYFILTIVSVITSMALARGTLIIETQNVTLAEGESIYFYLYDSELNWRSDQSVGLGLLDFSGFQKEFKVDLPAREYSVTAFHDRNENAELDRNFFGLPEEQFAISNIERTLWAPPDWDEVKFSLREGEVKRIRLFFRYH